MGGAATSMLLQQHVLSVNGIGWIGGLGKIGGIGEICEIGGQCVIVQQPYLSCSNI